jgi:hypothetical protein
MIVRVCTEHMDTGARVTDEVVIVPSGDCWFAGCDNAGVVPRIIPNPK